MISSIVSLEAVIFNEVAPPLFNVLGVIFGERLVIILGQTSPRRAASRIYLAAQTTSMRPAPRRPLKVGAP
eukprot:8769465-Pyramimonas_sp.AAC.1